MSCEQFNTRLTDFALGAEDAELGAHLDACASCRAALEAQRALLASIDRGLVSVVAEAPSGDFAAHVRRRIAENAPAPRPWFAGWMPITAAALALVVLVGVLTIGRPPRPPQSASVTPPALFAPPDAVRTTAPPLVARGPRPPRAGQMAANREPEVLVPRGQMAAVMQLYDSVWNGKADGASLTAQAAPMSETLKPMFIEELKIPALEVVPLERGEPPSGSPEK